MHSGLASLMNFTMCPIDCLSLHAQQIRKRHVKERFKEEAVAEHMAWEETAVITMDLTERSHNHLRTELQSSGRTRDINGAVNRTFVRQCAVAHTKRGGVPCSGRAPVESIRRLGEQASMPNCIIDEREDGTGIADQIAQCPSAAPLANNRREGAMQRGPPDAAGAVGSRHARWRLVRGGARSHWL